MNRKAVEERVAAAINMLVDIPGLTKFHFEFEPEIDAAVIVIGIGELLTCCTVSREMLTELKDAGTFISNTMVTRLMDRGNDDQKNTEN